MAESILVLAVVAAFLLTLALCRPEHEACKPVQRVRKIGGIR